MSFRWTSGRRRQADPDRNLTHLRESLLDHAPLRPDHVHAMPVEAADLDRAAEQYALTLREVAGSPPVLDLVHLGLGPGRPHRIAGAGRSGRSMSPTRTSP